MDAVLEHADAIPGKLGENLRDNKEQAIASRRVATIVRDVQISLDFEDVSFPAFDPAEVRRSFGTYALNTHLRKILRLIDEGNTQTGGEQRIASPGQRIANAQDRLGQAIGSKPTPKPVGPTAATPTPTSQLSSPSPFSPQLETFLLDLEQHGPVTGKDAQAALDACLNETECPAVPTLILHIAEVGGATLFDQAVRRLYIATLNSTICFEEEDIQPALMQVFRHARVAALNIKSLLQELVPRDSSKPAVFELHEVDPDRLFDFLVVAYLLDSSKSYETIQELAEQFLPEAILNQIETLKDIDAEKDPDVGLTALAFAVAMYHHLKAALEQDGSASCYQQIESPLIPVLVAMERVGVHVDPLVLNGLSTQFAATIDAQRKRAYELAGEEFNLDSPKQLGFILFEKLKLPTQKKTRTGAGYSTNAAVLQELSPLNPLPALMLEYRELAKLKSTYLDALPQLILKDRHLHTSFNQTVAATGRLSSSDPNLQNIPVRTDLGRQIRTAFIADASAFDGQDAVFLSADYSQIELRLLAHLSGDEHLINAFKSGEDFHSSTAARVFGVPLASVTPQMRSRAKAVNFGIVYGQQAYGLAQSLDISFTEAQEMIKRYFDAYPQVQTYLKGTVSQAYDQGWIATLFGRKRHIHELFSGNSNQRGFGERIAMNHPMQGSAADIIKLAMIEVARRLQAEGLVSQMVLQVHDELVFNCASSEIEKLSALVKEAMEGVIELKVPLIVDIGYGSNWAEAH